MKRSFKEEEEISVVTGIKEYMIESKKMWRTPTMHLDPNKTIMNIKRKKMT